MRVTLTPRTLSTRFTLLGRGRKHRRPEQERLYLDAVSVKYCFDVEGLYRAKFGNGFRRRQAPKEYWDKFFTTLKKGLQSIPCGADHLTRAKIRGFAQKRDKGSLQVVRVDDISSFWCKHGDVWAKCEASMRNPSLKTAGEA